MSNAARDPDDLARLVRIGSHIQTVADAPCEVQPAPTFTLRAPPADRIGCADSENGESLLGCDAMLQSTLRNDNPVTDSEPESEPLLMNRKGQSQEGVTGGRKHSSHASADTGAGLSKGKSSKWQLKNTRGLGVRWLFLLRQQYGQNLLLLLFASQHVLKGVVQQFQTTAALWVFRDSHISGPRIQVYLSISNSAWALKPIIGMISDLVPIAGLNKAPYVVITSLIGVTCTAMIGFSTRDTMSALTLVFCLFGMSLQGATCDLLTEAKYSEQLAKKPAYGPDLLTFIWGGISAGNMIAISCVGLIVVTMGPRAVFLVCLVPASAILYPTLMNYFDEHKVTAEEKRKVREHFMKQKEVLALGLLMCACTIGLSLTGAFAQSRFTTFCAALGVLSLLLPSFYVVLRPEIAKVNTFFVLQSALSLGINGATFYFYTDKPSQYPGGPHFSVWFFSTGLGLVSAVMSLVGLSTYNHYMRDWTYQGLLLFCNIVVTLLYMLDMLMYTRLNLWLGIPDVMFVLGSSVSEVVIRQWQWMPGMVILSQLCPAGMEATMFALLAGCANIGNTIADYMGAYLLEVLHVHPTGAAGEGVQFNNLWMASGIATLLPALTIAMIPYLIPQAKQTDKLILSDPGSATAGSPLSRWLGKSAEAQQPDASASRHRNYSASSSSALDSGRV